MLTLQGAQDFEYRRVIAEICDLSWGKLTEDETLDLAWAYYFFSVQFRENLEIARELYPDDEKLQELEQGECNTDNLSPWPGVASAGEKLNHDEFMKRLLTLAPIPEDKRQFFQGLGNCYLDQVRELDPLVRARSLASYEDGGLEQVFRAMLNSPRSQNQALRAFRHFLSEHIRFDSDTDAGHGALIRHLRPDDQILPLWDSFRRLLTDFVPGLAQKT
jgi:hypothetical protein